MHIKPNHYTGPFYEAARSIVETLQKRGFRAFFVGGCVRDAILDHHPEEYDITTSATPSEVREIFDHTVPVGESFGVILVLIDGYKYEVASFRKEWGYEDGRRPSEVSYSSDEKDDVIRRDFTINGFLYDPIKEELYDYVNGLKDLERGVIETIGDPVERFNEDKLRMIRAVRFSARFEFRIEERTFHAIESMADRITEVSAERLRDEIVRIITQQNPGYGLRMLKQTNLLRFVLPEVQDMDNVPQPPEFHPEGDVFRHTCIVLEELYDIMDGNIGNELAMGALLHDIGKPPTYEEKDRIRFNGHDRVGARMAQKVCKRLRFSKKQTERITALVRDHLKFKDVFNMRESTLRRFISTPYFGDHLNLHLADCRGSHGMTEAYDFIRKKLEEYKHTEIKPKPLLSGNDLIDLGYEPGPLFSEILNDVEEQQLEGTLKNKNEAVEYVEQNFRK